MFEFLTGRKKKTKVVKQAPLFRTLPPEAQEKHIAKYAFGIFAQTLKSATHINILNSYYKVYVRNEKSFGYRIEKDEDKSILKILMHQILQCMLQIYVNNLLFSYYKIFYYGTLVSPNVKENMGFVDLRSIITINGLISLMEKTRMAMPMSKLFQETNNDVFLLDSVNDVNSHATKLYCFTESFVTTFSRDVLTGSIDVFVRDYINVLKHKTTPKENTLDHLLTFYAIFAVFFNERFKKLFYEKNDRWVLNNDFTITYELSLGLSIYQSLTKDIKELSLDFKALNTALILKNNDQKANFKEVIKTEICHFIDKCTAIQNTLNDKAFVSTASIQPMTNVVDMTDRFQRNKNISTVIKQAEDVKRTLT